MVDGVPSLNLARLLPDGRLDRDFRVRGGAAGPVYDIRVLPDGRVLLAGDFDTLGGRTIRKIARVNADGSHDFSFRSPNPNSLVSSAIPLPDGRIMLNGLFTAVGGRTNRFVALLRADGSVDPGFDTGLGLGESPNPLASLNPLGLVLEPSGTALVLGGGNRFNGELTGNLVRLRLGDVPPMLTVPTEVPEGLKLTAHGIPGGIYPLETSTNLVHWESAGELRLEGYATSADRTLPMTGAQTPRLYRLQVR
jgi:hypothetical protein